MEPETVFIVEGASVTGIVNKALVFEITMSEVALADNTFTPTQTCAIAILAVADVPTIAWVGTDTIAIAVAEVFRLIPAIIRIHLSRRSMLFRYQFNS